MNVAILSSQGMVKLESAALSEGLTVRSLIECAVTRSTQLFQELFPASEHPNIALLVGSGHNGCDALGIGCELLREQRTVVALLVGNPDLLKPETLRMSALFTQMGGTLVGCSTQDEFVRCSSHAALHTASVWIDGLFGFGLNRPVAGLFADAIRFVNSLNKDVVALDVPSGLSCDFGLMGDTQIFATRTFALGAFKPAHVDDHCTDALGQLHWIDLDLLPFKQRISVPDWTALHPNQLKQLIQSVQRKSASHKVINGRTLIIAGSKRYPGAAVLTCLGASVSGAGMVHALVPECSQSALLIQQPEIIFESRTPALDKFNSIVLGPGWVPGDSELFEHILRHARVNPDVRVILDAGSFRFVEKKLKHGQSLTPNVILTPHYGEFATLFPEIVDRVESTEPSLRINRIEAAAWAASLSSALVIFKGARTHVASPDGSVASILRSTSLLAHAGQGDVFAGLLGGVCAHTNDIKKAAYLAALLQAEVAVKFSSTHPSALTLRPSELVRQLPRFLPPEG